MAIEYVGILGGTNAYVTLPLPTRYDSSKGLVKGRRPLPAPATKVVTSAANVATVADAVAYARAGYRASINLSQSQPAKKTAWESVAEAYAFPHDVNEWVQRDTLGYTEAMRSEYVKGLRYQLDYADKTAARTKGGTSAPATPPSTPSSGTSTRPQPPPLPEPPPIPDAKRASIFGKISPTLLIVGGVGVLAIAILPGILKRRR